MKRRRISVGNSNDIWVCPDKHYKTKVRSSHFFPKNYDINDPLAIYGAEPKAEVITDVVVPGQPLSEHSTRIRPGTVYNNHSTLANGVGVKFKGAKVLEYSQDHEQIIYDTWTECDTEKFTPAEAKKALRELIIQYRVKRKIADFYNMYNELVYELDGVDLESMNLPEEQNLFIKSVMSLVHKYNTVLKVV